MKLLVCGGREYRDKDTLFALLDEIDGDEPISLVIHGACPVGAGGADILAEKWAKSRQIPYLGHPAQFKRLGRQGGPRRNAAMLDAWGPHMVLAFPGGKGTADMVRKAEAAGVPVRHVA